jgi:hypothetical protein
MILTHEQAILKGKDQFQEMAGLIQRAAREGRSIDGVERDLWRGLLALGHTLMQAYVAGQGAGDLGPTLQNAGRTLRRLEPLHPRRYVSVFGELTILRHVYGTRETQKHEVAPLDARLNLPAGEFSYLLQEWDQAACVQDSYEESRASMQRILGLGQSVRSLEHMTGEMAGSVEGFRARQPAPPAAEEGSILVLTADGKGVPMRREAGEAGPGGRRKKGEKANKKRMACVGSVYTIEPFPRTARDVVDEVMRERAREKRPVPRHKQVRAELTRPIQGQEINGKDRIFQWFAEQASQRNPGGVKPVVCLMDGERALWKMLSVYFVLIVCILDIFHVLERLWQAAHCFHPEGSDQARAFVSQRLERILQGEVGRVIGGLRQMAHKQGLKGARMERLQSAIGYLENNRRFMRYDEYLAAGYPIGSGVAEGACRHLVKDRMERTGMRWRTPGAQAMLDLRAVHISDQWEAFSAYRVESECRRLYPYRELVQSKYLEAA